MFVSAGEGGEPGEGGEDGEPGEGGEDGEDGEGNEDEDAVVQNIQEAWQQQHHLGNPPMLDLEVRGGGMWI